MSRRFGDRDFLHRERGRKKIQSHSEGGDIPLPCPIFKAANVNSRTRNYRQASIADDDGDRGEIRTLMAARTRGRDNLRNRDRLEAAKSKTHDCNLRVSAGVLHVAVTWLRAACIVAQRQVSVLGYRRITRCLVSSRITETSRGSA